MKNLYRKLLRKLVRRELKRIADLDKCSRHDLMEYHELMAITMVGQETEAQRRIFSISIQTAEALDPTWHPDRVFVRLGPEREGEPLREFVEIETTEGQSVRVSVRDTGDGGLFLGPLFLGPQS